MFRGNNLAHVRGCLTALCLAGLSSGLYGQTVSAGGNARELTVMSYNILHGTNVARIDTLTSQGTTILAAHPDFVGLQEVDNKCARSGKVDEMAVLAKVTGMHPAFGAHFDYQGGQYGNGLLSRWPLTDVRTDRISLITKNGEKETRALLSALATMDNGTTVVVASVHMGLNQQSRLIQAEEIIGFLKGRGAPVILTGDFNAEPETAELKKLESYFVNAGKDATTEFTFAVGAPSKTIDFIMVNRENYASTLDFKVLRDVTWSDHFPIIARIKLR